MSDPNLKAMTQAELLKYLEDDFMPRLLPKLANVQNIEAENARLKAEVERLRASSFVTAVPVEEYERLRNAGDAMQDRLGCKCGWLLCKGCQEAENNWEKAKEGKQS